MVKKKMPLKDRRIVVTRAQAQAGRLSGLLAGAGAEVLELPLIEIQPLEINEVADDIFGEIAVYEWIAFTSANGVRLFFEQFFRRFKDLRCLGPMRIACVGAATAREVESFHLQVDCVPEEATAESLAHDLIATGSLASAKVLLVTGTRSRKVLYERLERDGEAIVDVLELYHTHNRDLKGDSVAGDFRARGADAIVFTSSSTVEAFVEQAAHLQLDAGAQRPACVSIGPVTSDTLRQKKMPVDLESPEAELERLVEALGKHFSSKG